MCSTGKGTVDNVDGMNALELSCNWPAACRVSVAGSLVCISGDLTSEGGVCGRCIVGLEYFGPSLVVYKTHSANNAQKFKHNCATLEYLRFMFH